MPVSRSTSTVRLVFDSASAKFVAKVVLPTPPFPEETGIILILSPYFQIYHKRRIKAIRERHNYHTEFKWSKVSNSKYGFYNDIIDYFFETDIKFRAIVINKEQIRNDEFTQTFDEFYYKMYYQSPPEYMLAHPHLRHNNEQ